MLRFWQSRAEAALVAFIGKTYGLTLEHVEILGSRRLEFGDLSTPIAFDLAKALRKAPRQIAQEIVAHIGAIEGIRKIEAAGGGFVNLFFNRGLFAAELYNNLAGGGGTLLGRTPSQGKIIVEHTNINPNKAAHIGHLRNAVIGDTFVRLLRFLGERVEVQNYIDNTGVQVADVVVGFQQFEQKTITDLKAMSGKFDYYCWDLYAKITEFYERDPSHLEWRRQTLRALEAGDNETAAFADYIAMRIAQAHLATMARIGVTYELLPRESDILHLKFWDHAFGLLKAHRAIGLATEGKHAGCWVMKLAGDGESASGEDEDSEKIIVRSDGTVTYVGKDIAYQLWKFGLLGMDFYYRPFSRPVPEHTVWTTASAPGNGETAPPFGGATRVYNVIDTRQMYLQKVVSQGLQALGYTEQAANSIHFSYERVALSPACAAELGYQNEEETPKRPVVDVSGRKGQGVKADDLLDKLLEQALNEVRARHPLSEAEARRTAEMIAAGALRYFLIKYTRNSLIAFDFKEALSFDGETGPYLQYSVVRANNIFRKLQETGDRSVEQLAAFANEANLGAFLDEEDLWELVLLSARFSEMARLAVQSMEVSHVAKFAFALAQKFNLFYHKHRIIGEPDQRRKLLLLIVADMLRTGLTQILEVMGIEVPPRM